MNEVEKYIKQFPEHIQILLNQVRETIRETAPDAAESIAYQMPAYKQNSKPLVYFAGFKNHIGFYPVSSGIDAFKEELSTYKKGKGSVQFPYSRPLPIELITKIVKFRVNVLNGLGQKNPIR
jgi:uncharacterized protein YdhG (YjbR/CyaY superfamily)